MKQVTRTEKQGAREENRRALMQNRSKDNKSQNEKKEPKYIDYRMMSKYC